MAYRHQPDHPPGHILANQDGSKRCGDPPMLPLVATIHLCGRVSNERLAQVCGWRVHHPTAPVARRTLGARKPIAPAWKAITPLARKEFICWVEDAKQTMVAASRP